ncbi:MAG: hypothetical protein AAF125_07740 [Chloroflexota bacterium]
MTPSVRPQNHTFDSEHTGRTYQVSVSLPLAYAAKPGAPWPFHNPLDQWPTVYVLDGDWYAPMVTGMIGPTAWCGRTQDAICGWRWLSTCRRTR